MSDLISRSELINALKVHFDSCFREDGELLYSDHICTSDDVVDLIKLVENQPTAYSVGKVVEELKSLQTYNMGFVTLMSDLQRNGVYRHYVCLEDAIEIVKQGGIKNINHKVCIPDVCEWKDKELYGYYTSCTEFRSCIACKDTYWKYCPYCGKKIKIVGD